MFRDLGDKVGSAMTLSGLGNYVRARGESERAVTLCTESAVQFRELGDKRGLTLALIGLGDALLDREDRAGAVTAYTEGLATCYGGNVKIEIAGCFDRFARLAARDGHLERAVRFFAAAVSLRETIGIPALPRDRAINDRWLIDVQRTMNADAFAATWAIGAKLTIDQAVAAATEQENP